jgi:hypothetical protein
LLLDDPVATGREAVRWGQGQVDCGLPAWSFRR